MSFLDIFVEVEDKQPGGGKKNTPAPSRPTQTVAPQPVAVQQPVVDSGVNYLATPTSVAPAVAESDDAMVERLERFICEHNLPGPDYLELKNNASALVNFIKDESAQYKAAFDVLKNSYPDITKEKILASIDKYVSMLETERQNGLKECESKLKENDYTSKIEGARSRCEEYAKQIKALEDAYASMKATLADLEEKQGKAQAEYESNRSRFNASVDTVVDILNSDKEKIANLTL